MLTLAVGAAAVLAGCGSSVAPWPGYATAGAAGDIGGAAGSGAADADVDGAAGEADGGDDADAPAGDAPGEAVTAGDTSCPSVATNPTATSSPVSGTLLGPNLRADVCGGTYALLETAATVPFLMVINGGFNAGEWRFQSPADATTGGLISFFGVDAAPGTYSTAAGDCGQLSLCVRYPVPASLDCGTGKAGCPPGCAFAGSVSAPACVPITPEDCYVAVGTSSCVGAQTPRGSWTLTLSSVGAFVPTEGGARTDGKFPVHGTLDATLVKDGPDAGAATATLDLAF